MSTLSDMADIDQIAHWYYILTNGQYTLITSDKAQPKYTFVVKWVVVGFRRVVTPRSWQGRLKVMARSNQLKTAEMQFFCCFFYNYVHFR